VILSPLTDTPLSLRNNASILAKSSIISKGFLEAAFLFSRFSSS
jgi:hypothetical protein